MAEMNASGKKTFPIWRWEAKTYISLEKIERKIWVENYHHATFSIKVENAITVIYKKKEFFSTLNFNEEKFSIFSFRTNNKYWIK